MKKPEKSNTVLRNDELVNYNFRPAKNIERKMFCEVFGRLASFASLQEYQYVGFSSTYFVDFSLFHKALGIKKLITIEGDLDMEERIRYNLPYSCVDVKPGRSIEMLPEVEWESQKSILWLDYIDNLKGYMFKDMATFFNRANSGSIFLISVNVDLKDEANGKKTISEKIVSKISKDNDVKKRIRSSSLIAPLGKENYYSILHDVIHQEIIDVLEERNKAEPDTRFKYQQIFNFIYKDSVMMMTIGGILYSENDMGKVDQMSLSGLDFVRDDDRYFEIKVPFLTNREMYALNKHLPTFNTNEEARVKAIEELQKIVGLESIEKYAKIYRYFPIFSEIIL